VPRAAGAVHPAAGEGDVRRSDPGRRRRRGPPEVLRQVVLTATMVITPAGPEQGYGQDKPERCSKPTWPSSRASTFGTAEGPIAGGAVCSLKPLTRSFGPKAPGSLKSEQGVGFRERVVSEARVSTLGGPAARSLVSLLSRENISNCGFRAYLGCTPTGPTVPGRAADRSRGRGRRATRPAEVVLLARQRRPRPAHRRRHHHRPRHHGTRPRAGPSCCGRYASSRPTRALTPTGSPTTANAAAPARPSPPPSPSPRSTRASPNAWSRNSRCAGHPAAPTCCYRYAPACSTTSSPATSTAGTPASPGHPTPRHSPRSLPYFVPLSERGAFRPWVAAAVRKENAKRMQDVRQTKCFVAETSALVRISFEEGGHSGSFVPSDLPVDRCPRCPRGPSRRPRSTRER
jgi:hypothetical protein